MIVSDHGMTESGNHGGSSYEETDSLALFASAQKFRDVENRKEAYQVDIASTLALLFGVPIPVNNVGTVMSEVFTSLEDEQQLRLLELNSWQLLRLLQTHLTELECGRSSCASGSDKNGGAERFCCSYLAAAALHRSWASKNSSRSVDRDGYRSLVLAYHDFLGSASEWLSSRSTDKPIGLLALGIFAMALSCLGLMSLLFLLRQKVNFKWHLDESFILSVIFILVLSMGSSSMVEEEQYIWHFMTSSLYFLLLRRTIQSITNSSSLTSTLERSIKRSHSIYSIIAVLICGRILRGWHQGGVNWTYLPDISKLLEEAGTVYIKSLHLLSVVLVIICLTVLLLAKLSKRRFLVVLLILIYLFPLSMILKQILKHQDNTRMIQTIYALIGTSTVGIFVAVPWLMPLQNPVLGETRDQTSFGGFGDSVYVIVWCYISSWSLLQMLLQQPINSMPTALLLVQIVASIHYFSEGGVHHKQWVKIASLYYVGMAGHFGLGNTNTLATIDVAGAFIGISSHSTIISGILMFIITYASPMLALLSMLMVIDVRAFANSEDVDLEYVLKMALGYPCLVPLGLNSILLLVYTIILLLMRNHLFVWSVFSPKYMYVCATTACVYIGVSIVALTVTYTCIVFAARRKLKCHRRE